MTNKNGIFKKIHDIVFILEIILAGFLIIGVIIGMKDIFSYLIDIYRTGAIETYDIFRQFLAHVLLLVVAIELILMLISHSIDSIIEFILFVIARNMLIHAESMLDFLLGALSIAILFLTIKIFFIKNIFNNKNDKGLED